MAHLAIDFDELLKRLGAKTYTKMLGRLAIEPLFPGPCVVVTLSRHSIIGEAVEKDEGAQRLSCLKNDPSFWP